MSEVETVSQEMAETVAPESAPVVPETPAPVELPELRYEYQPMDPQGRPVGGKQVIKYRTAQELGDKLAEQNKLLILKLREETRKNRLGIIESEQLPEDAERFVEPVRFKPRTLAAEERFKLAQDLIDPERFDTAMDTLFEAKMGVKPEVLGKTLEELQNDSIRSRAKIEADAFVAETPEYIKCAENFSALTNWMVRYNLAPVKANFKKAFEALRKDGVLFLRIQDEQPEEAAPVVTEPEVPVTPAATVEPVAPPVVEEPAAPVVPAESEQAPAKPTPRIGTGLTRTNAEDSGPQRQAGDDIVFEVIVGGQKRRYTGMAAINAMPSEEFKQRLQKDPTFSKRVEQLEREASERRKSAARR